MNLFLTWVLLVKIAATLVLWALPALLLRLECFMELGFPQPVPVLWVRLMGMAYLSLALVYWQGMRLLHRGEFPLGTIQVGILSNGCACFILLNTLLFSDLDGWTCWSLPYLWLSAGLTFGITASLLACLKARLC